jgi:hypothetical protein
MSHSDPQAGIRAVAALARVFGLQAVVGPFRSRRLLPGNLRKTCVRQECCMKVVAEGEASNPNILGTLAQPCMCDAMRCWAGYSPNRL